MSVFKKIKDVLFDIEEEEEEKVIKEPVKVVKESNPIKEVKMPVNDSFDDEIEAPKKSSNFNFPLDFDDDLPTRSSKSNDVDVKKSSVSKKTSDLFDDDFDVPRRNREDYLVKENNHKIEQPRDYSKYLQPKKEEKKIFTPSPVISPVYGVLNQNYTKDDVIVKTDTGVKSPSLDEVRKKAYEKKKSEENKKVDDEFEEPLKTLDEILINSHTDKEDSKLEDDILNDYDNKEEVINNVEDVKTEDKEDNTDDDSLEKDLFSLIDSMYENKDEEEEE